jgi:hypothetical protein
MTIGNFDPRRQKTVHVFLNCGGSMGKCNCGSAKTMSQKVMVHVEDPKLSFVESNKIFEQQLLGRKPQAQSRDGGEMAKLRNPYDPNNKSQQMPFWQANKIYEEKIMGRIPKKIDDSRVSKIGNRRVKQLDE